MLVLLVSCVLSACVNAKAAPVCAQTTLAPLEKSEAIKCRLEKIQREIEVRENQQEEYFSKDDYNSARREMREIQELEHERIALEFELKKIENPEKQSP